jgi:outer membrane protein assembly factor BamB
MRLVFAFLLMWIFIEPASAEFGEELFVLVPADAASGWGLDGGIAINGDSVVVGGTRREPDGARDGAAYLFDLGSGAQLSKFATEDSGRYDGFGAAVALGEGYVLVGAPGGGGASHGAAYLFNTSSGAELHKFAPNSTRSYFGRAVAIEGDVGVIGHSGSAVVVDLATAEVELTLTPTNPAVWGRPIVVDSGIALIGDPYDGQGGYQAGAAHLVTLATGEKLHKLVSDDLFAIDWFGDAADIAGGLALVGAPYHRNSEGIRTGAAYLFDVASGEQIAKFAADDLQKYDTFGQSVALSGGFVFVGAPGHDGDFQDSGAVYVFDLATGDQIDKLMAADAVASSRFGQRLTADGERLLVSASQGSMQTIADAGTVRVIDIARESLVGDFNNDGVVDAADYTVLRDGLGQSYLASARHVWQGAYGASNSPPSTLVPEPGALMLAFVAMTMPRRSRTKCP